MVSPNVGPHKEGKLLYPDHHLIRCTKSGFRPTQGVCLSTGGGEPHQAHSPSGPGTPPTPLTMYTPEQVNPQTRYTPWVQIHSPQPPQTMCTPGTRYTPPSPPDHVHPPRTRYTPPQPRHTPHPCPRYGHCCGRYTSYCNLFLFLGGLSLHLNHLIA